MNQTVKEKAVNLEDLQAFVRTVFNKGFGNSGTCSTAGATAAKEVTLGTTFELVSGATMLVKFSNGIFVANATLAVTHTTLAGITTTEAAKPIYLNGAALPSGVVPLGAEVILRYDGTNFNIIGSAGGDYTLPIASSNELGGVKIGENMSIDNSGVLSAKKTIGYGTCSTAAATAAKEVTIADFEFASDSTIVVKFTNGISVANATLSVNSGTAVPIYYRGAALGADMVKVSDSVTMHYNGTQLDVIGDLFPEVEARFAGNKLVFTKGGVFVDNVLVLN